AKSSSIIAVRGLNPGNRDHTAHAWDTWRTPSGPTGRLWLRDALPREIPPCRIFLYEYNSTAVYGTSRATFTDKANGLLEFVRIERDGIPKSRPIIFLGHDMGGLLIKQALINAKSNARFQDIKDATYGLCFFATPYGGDERTTVRLGRSLANTAIRAGFKKGDNVVPRESALMGLASDREAVVMLKATHGKVCNFGDSEDDQINLKTVQSNLQGLCQWSLEKSESLVGLRNSTTLAPSQTHTGEFERATPQAHYYLPLSKNKSFTGREDILAELQNKHYVQSQYSRIAISGLGGVGKTQIALQLAHWVRENRPEVSIFWISALSNASFEHAYMEIAKELPIPLNNHTEDLKQTVRRYLSVNQARPWLLIVDNVDDKDMFFPSSSSNGFYHFLPENDD
ncbi:unnamed protein product, partial [Clonostachys chloroleuca]